MKLKPVIFLTFANDPNGQFLEALRPEQDGINYHLAPFQKNHQGIVFNSAASGANEILEGLNQFSGQLIIFHFSGHSDGKRLQLEYDMGETYSQKDSMNQALTYFEKSHVLLKQLYESSPDNTNLSYGLAYISGKLGETHSSLGNVDQALTFLKKDKELTLSLYTATPENVQYAYHWICLNQILGIFYFEQLKDPQRAREHLELGQKLCKELVKSSRENKTYQKTLKEIEAALKSVKK